MIIFQIQTQALSKLVYLSPDAHVFIRREIRPVVVCGTGTKVDESTKGHNREADKIGGHFPILAATI